MKKNMIKEISTYLIGTIAVSLLGFIMSLLYSKMFYPNEYGIYSLVYSMYNLIFSIYGGWISLSILRNAKIYKNNNKEKILFSSFYIFHIAMSIVFIIVLNFVLYFIKVESLYKQLFFIFSIIYFFEEELLIINTYLRTEENAKQYSINTTLNNLLKIIALLVIYYLMGYKDIKVIAISLLISEVVQCIYLYKKINLKQYYSRKNFDINIIKKMFIFGFPLIGVSVTSWILNVSDRYIINIFYTASEVGIYSYAYSIGNSIFNLLIQFIMLGAYPKIVKTWEEEGKSETINIIKNYLTIYFLIIIPAIVGVICVANDFFNIFTAEAYRSGYIVFIITCISIGVLGLSQYTNKVWELNKNTKMIFILNLITALLNIILNFLLIPKIGYWIAAVTTLISYVFYLILSIVTSRKLLKLSIDIKKTILILLSSIIMFIIMKIYNQFVEIDSLLKLILQILIGVSTYIILIFTLKVINLKEIHKMLKRGD